MERNVPATGAGLTHRYYQTHHPGLRQNSLAVIYRLDDLDFYIMASILLFFFHSCSRLHWKPILYHVARASNEADQTDRDE